MNAPVKTPATIPFDAARLDRWMDEEGIDVLIANTKHNVQYLLGGHRAFFFDYMDAMGVSRYLPLAGPFRRVSFSEPQSFRESALLRLVALSRDPVAMTNASAERTGRPSFSAIASRSNSARRKVRSSSASTRRSVRSPVPMAPERPLGDDDAG